MAKRPPSNPTAEEDVVKPAEIEPIEPREIPDVDPVSIKEPPTAGPDPVEPEPMVTQDPVHTGPDPVEYPAVQPVEKARSNGFLGTALGGVVAAAAGYALATFVPFPGIGTSDEPVYATQANVQALTARIDSLESAPAPDTTLADRIAALEARPELSPSPEPDLSPLTNALSALEVRFDELESRGPVATTGEAPSADLLAAVESLRAEVAEMQASGADANAGLEALAAETEARLAEAESQAVALRAEAEETARKAVTAAALGRVQAALESGAPFAGALADIPDVDIPPALANLAETGVPTLAMLEAAFPPAARAALEASLRADMGEGWSDRLASFLQATTGARSLAPREGTDPDAVLSRAEAAVRAGDLSQALAELQGLPPEGLVAMSDWTVMAQQRIDAVAAAAAVKG